MKSEIEVFRDFIRNKGLRNTPEREEVVRAVFASHDHFNVDELYARVQALNDKISRATVYRTIPLLLESGLIQQSFSEDGRLYYEHIYGHEHHCHLRCLGCGAIVEFSEEALPRIEEKLAQQHDFLVTGHRVEVFGYCMKCKAHVEGSAPPAKTKY